MLTVFNCINKYALNITNSKANNEEINLKSRLKEIIILPKGTPSGSAIYKEVS
jgi:hypothetical protein